MFTQWRKIYSDLKSSIVSNLIRGREAVSGSTAIEVAFAAPVLFLFMFGVIEVGRVMFTQGVMKYAVYEASRYADIHYGAPADEIKKVAADSFILIDPSNISSFTVTAVDNGDKTKFVTLKLAYMFNFLVPIVSTEPITLTADAKILTVTEL